MELYRVIALVGGRRKPQALQSWPWVLGRVCDFLGVFDTYGLPTVGMLVSDSGSVSLRGQGEELAGVRAVRQAGGNRGSAFRAGPQTDLVTLPVPGLWV